MFKFKPLFVIGGALMVQKLQISLCKPGNDPLDCDKPACADTLDMFKKAMKADFTKNNRTNSKAQSADKISTQANSSPFIAPVVTLPIPKELKGCPADKELLGRSTWLLLHTMVANYPQEPLEEDKERAVKFIESLAFLYPCPYCAKDFQSEIKKSPPDVSSRESLSIWLCKQHNIVNAKTNKPSQFPCDIKSIDERWKYGERSCWDTLEDE